MSDKARELLSRCLRRFNKSEYECSQLVEDIELYLAETEKQEPLSGEEIGLAFIETGFDAKEERLLCFLRGVDFAEKHHGIGGKDER